jgi:hypothetical protein
MLYYPVNAGDNRLRMHKYHICLNTILTYMKDPPSQPKIFSKITTLNVLNFLFEYKARQPHL